jgi:TusA-related sulfurtransferase
MSGRIQDALGLKCPQPLFEVNKSMKDLAAGETLEVHADDPAFKLDIEAWCRRTGNVLVELRREGSRFVAILRKAG